MCFSTLGYRSTALPWLHLLTSEKSLIQMIISIRVWVWRLSAAAFLMDLTFCIITLLQLHYSNVPHYLQPVRNTLLECEGCPGGALVQMSIEGRGTYSCTVRQSEFAKAFGEIKVLYNFNWMAALQAIWQLQQSSPLTTSK